MKGVKKENTKLNYIKLDVPVKSLLSEEEDMGKNIFVDILKLLLSLKVIHSNMGCLMRVKGIYQLQKCTEY